MTARGLMIAAPSSGAGKTVIAAGLLRAFRNRGVAVQGAKSGPDYIDPAFHAAASGRDCVNLDSWAMPPALLDTVLADAAGGVDLVLAEGAMGLFDGLPAGGRSRGAAADLAARFGLPVVLVLDATGMTQSAAAVARGFAAHDPAVRVAGVILNRVASERHRAYVADAIIAGGLPVLGALGRDEAFALPSRHLGLVQAGEHGDLDARLQRIATAIEAGVDLEALLALAPESRLPAVGARRCRRRERGSRAPATTRSASSTRTSSRDGAPRSSRSRRSPTSRPPRIAIAAGSPAAIRSFMPGVSPLPARSWPASGPSPRPAQCTASAGVTWCSARGWRMRMGTAMSWPACSAMRRASRAAA